MIDMPETFVIDWITSYLVGSIPTLKDLFSKNKDLESRIDACYQAALKKWCPNTSVRERVSVHFTSVDSLRAYMLSKPNLKEYGVDRLLHLWSDELRKDEICYNFILETKIDKVNDTVDDIAVAVKESTLQNKAQLDYITQLIQSGNSGRLMEFLRNFIDESIIPLIESLKVKSALDVLESIEHLCKDVLSAEVKLRSELLYLKGKSLRYLNPADAIDYFHKAYSLNPDAEENIIAEIKRCISRNDADTARLLTTKLQPDNIYRQAAEIVLSDNPVAELALYPTLSENLVAKQEICELIMLTGTHGIDFLFVDDCVCVIPQLLTYSNLKEWLYIITYHRIATPNILIVRRDFGGEKYVDAYNFVNEFIVLLADTDLKDAFPIVNSLYHYWGYMIDGEKSRIREYQRIDRSGIGDQKQIFKMYEICMLQMAGLTEEAFAAMCAMSDSIDQSIIDLSMLIGHDYKSDDYIRFGLKQARDNKIAISSFCSTILASYLNHETVTVIEEFINDLAFINPLERELLIQLCNFAKNDTVDTSGFKDKTEDLSDELTAFAALLMAKNGEDELAVKILTPIVDEQTLDLKARIFIDVLSCNTYHHPHLYRLLKDNRKRGVCQIDLLKKEAHLAAKLADYSGALEVLEILRRECPNEPEISFNYINVWLRSGKPLTDDLKQIIERLDISSADRVHFIYKALAETNHIEYAAKFLHDKTVALDDDDLRHMFLGESTAGYIAKVVCVELDEVKPGVCVMLKYRDRHKAIIVKENINLGKELIGKRKGDIVTVQRDEYEILSIHPHYFKLHADYLDEVLTGGGNEKMRPFFLEENNILGSFENAIRQFSPDSVNYEERRQKKIDEYKKGNIPYSHLIEMPDVIGGYYKGLFTPFEYKVPVAYTAFDTVSRISDESKFVVELPSLLLLFEFSNKYGYLPKVKPIVSHVLNEYLKYKKTFLSYHVSFPFNEAICAGSITRYSDNLLEDIQLRMAAMIKWLEDNCQIVTNEEALAMEDKRSNDSELSRLFQHTISFLMRKDANYILVSDEPYYSRLIQALPVISTEVFVKLFNEECYSDLLHFMFDCHICGASLTEQIIVGEYEKFEAGENNRFGEIVEYVRINPLSFSNVLSASIILASEKGDSEMLVNALTDLLESSFTIVADEFFQSQEWRNLIVMLTLPIKGYEVVKKCLLEAKRRFLS